MSSELGKEQAKSCVCFSLCKAGRAVTQMYDAMLRPVGISARQLALLGCIKRLADAHVTDIAEAMGMDQTTATRNILLLEKLGYVEPVDHGGDARKKIVVLTAKGTEKHAEAYERWQRIHDRVNDKMGGEKLQQLFDLMDEVIELAK